MLLRVAYNLKNCVLVKPWLRTNNDDTTLVDFIPFLQYKCIPLQVCLNKFVFGSIVVTWLVKIAYLLHYSYAFGIGYVDVEISAIWVMQVSEYFLCWIQFV